MKSQREVRTALMISLASVFAFALSTQAYGATTHRYSFTSNANDSVGTANGTLVNGAAISAGQVTLNGSNQYVDLPGPTINFPTYTSTTLESWFSYTNAADWVRLFDFGDTNSGGAGRNYLFMSPRSGGGDYRAVISNADPGNLNEQTAAVSPALPTGSYHTSVVYDSAAAQMRLYVNGYQAASTAVTIPLSAVSNNLAYLGRSLYPDPYLTGSIDEFRFNNAALSATKVVASHALGPNATQATLDTVLPLQDARISALDFTAAVPGTINDNTGTGTGLTSRLPGTGGALPSNDPNLNLTGLNSINGQLQLTSTSSDINGQNNMPNAEFLGTRLLDLGFNGTQDFGVSAIFSNVPGLGGADQFGLYIGNNSAENVRAGTIGPNTILTVNNNGGGDSSPTFTGGQYTAGDTLVMTMQRVGGVYSFRVQDLTSGVVADYPLANTSFLNAYNDLYVGLFFSDVGTGVHKTVNIDAYTAYVVPEPSGFVLGAMGTLGLLRAYRRRKSSVR